MRRGVVVIVFARAPIAGAAKTRLIGRLGAWRAAQLHARLVRRALRTALASCCARVELHVTPTTRHRFFARCRDEFGVDVKAQRGADLGERMHGALLVALRRHRAAILIGADCPELRPTDLRRAARLLRGAAEVVIAPAEDGGSALIGARRISAALFDGVAWGGASVLAQTARRLQTSGYHWRALRTVWDLDRPEDLDRFESRRV